MLVFCQSGIRLILPLLTVKQSDQGAISLILSRPSGRLVIRCRRVGLTKVILSLGPV